MTSPTAKVFDNQSTSSAVIALGGSFLAIASVLAFMFFGAMSFLGAILCAFVSLVVFAIAAAIFAPLLAIILVPVVAIGYLLFGIAAAVCGLVCGLFGLPFFKDKTA